MRLAKLGNLQLCSSGIHLFGCFWLLAMAQLDQPQTAKVTQLNPEYQEPLAHNLVDGMMVPPFITQQRVDELKTFKLRPDDVFITTYSKSGTLYSI